MSQQTTVRAPIPRALRAYAMYFGWIILAFLSLCLGLPALAASTLWSGLLLRIFPLFWLNDTTIGAFSGEVFVALVMATLLVGSTISIIQQFILRRELHIPIQRSDAWVICTTLGWSGSLCSAALASMPLGHYLDQMLDRPLVPLLEGALIGLGGGLFVGILQWFVLRQAVRNARYWILATIIGWILGWVLFWSALDGFFSNWSIS